MAVRRAAAAKLDDNEIAVEIHAASLCGLIAIFILIYCIRIAFHTWFKHWTSRSLVSPFVRLSRRARRWLIQPVRFAPSIGHALLVAAYIVINVILSVVNFDRSNVKSWGERFGWMTAGNFAFIVFLALKNTPLGWLTGYTYERLQYLHRTAGYATVLQMLLHMITFTTDYAQTNKLFKLRTSQGNLMGIAAGCAMFLMFLGAISLRRTRYELFYATHVVLSLGTAITVGWHRPAWRHQLPYVACFIFGIWGVDRLIRGGRLIFNSINNTATLHSVATGGTRIVMKKPLLGAKPGNHCYIWIPRLGLLETHPFTIVSNGPSGLELVANSHDGFTKALYDYACSQPEATTAWASADGPYGTFPDLARFDRVVLVAGGSGATFTFGLALHMIEDLDANSGQKIDFIWAVKKNERLSWFSKHMETLHMHDPHVKVTIHVTDDGALPALSSNGESFLSDSLSSQANTTKQVGTQKLTAPSVAITDNSQLEKKNELERPTGRAGQGRSMSENIKHEKLQAEKLIQDIVQSATAESRVLIAACGPEALMQTVRQAAAYCIRTDGPAVELHHESFAW